LYQATNVLINGNGCKILITNPRLGFLDVNSSSNLIGENFFVDHEQRSGFRLDPQCAHAVTGGCKKARFQPLCETSHK